MAVNGHRRLAIASHCGPRNTWPDGTSSLIGRHPATLRNCLTVKQVHRELVLDFADPGGIGTTTGSSLPRSPGPWRP
jgi:hypothetical protein